VLTDSPMQGRRRRPYQDKCAGCLSEVLEGPGRLFRGEAAMARCEKAVQLPDAALAWPDAHDAAWHRPWAA
jgi:hypothetical protein